MVGMKRVPCWAFAWLHVYYSFQESWRRIFFRWSLTVHAIGTKHIYLNFETKKRGQGKSNTPAPVCNLMAMNDCQITLVGRLLIHFVDHQLLSISLGKHGTNIFFAKPFFLDRQQIEKYICFILVSNPTPLTHCTYKLLVHYRFRRNVGSHTHVWGVVVPTSSAHPLHEHWLLSGPRHPVASHF